MLPEISLQILGKIAEGLRLESVHVGEGGVFTYS